MSGYCVGPSDLQCCVTGSSSSQYGVDISVALSASSASCLVSAGVTFIIPRSDFFRHIKWFSFVVESKRVPFLWQR